MRAAIRPTPTQTDHDPEPHLAAYDLVGVRVRLFESHQLRVVTLGRTSFARDCVAVGGGAVDGGRRAGVGGKTLLATHRW